MAARSLNHPFTLQKDVVKLFCRATGAAGADPTGLVGPGVASLAYNSSTGLLTLTLQDKWNALLMFSAAVLDATTPDDWEVVPVSETVATTKIIQLAVFKGGTLANLSTDEQIMIEITLRNTVQTK